MHGSVTLQAQCCVSATVEGVAVVLAPSMLEALQVDATDVLQMDKEMLG